MDDSGENVFNVTRVLCSLIFLRLVSYFFIRSKEDRKREDDIPLAPNQIPVLGHALKYKSNPPLWIRQMTDLLGPIFRINMAGKIMTLIAQDSPALRQIVSSTESLVSAKDAMNTAGFTHTLGLFNVSKGTDIQKRVLKGTFLNSYEKEVPKIFGVFEKAIEIEVGKSNSNIKDLFMMFRCVYLRVSIDLLVGSEFLFYNESFLDKYINFQDHLEDATANAVVMPSILAIPFILMPVKRKRLKLQESIKSTIKNLEDKGVWLEELIKQEYSQDEIAELLVGMLFAFHKNPSIAASQAFLFFTEKISHEARLQCRKETEKINVSKTFESLDRATNLKMHCLETLRLTGHTIGALRTAKKDIQLRDTKYVIKKGDTIAIAHISGNCDASVWENPNEFNLNRPLSSYDDEFKFTTFSQGVHQCIGQKISVSMMQITLTILLNKYEVDLGDVMQIAPLSFERATLAQRKGDVPIKITKK